MSAIDTFLANNAKYADTFSSGEVSVLPVMKIAIVACMDSRMDICALLGLREGDAHLIRNAGGVVTEDVIRSLMISQRLLGTREIMLIHHTDCGALRFTDSELKDAIEEETGTRPPFAMEAFSDTDENVRKSITRIEQSPFVVHKDVVRGFVYEVESGRLREVETLRSKHR